MRRQQAERERARCAALARRLVLERPILLLTGSILAASPAYASDSPNVPAICERNEKNLWFTTTVDRTVTHVRYFSVPTGGSADLVDKLTKIATVTASVKFTSETTLEANEISAKASKKFGVELTASGTLTRQTSETVTKHLGTGRFAVFAGVKEFSGQWNATRCNNNGTHEQSFCSGSTVSFAVPGDGAADCTKKYPSDTFEYRARRTPADA